MISKYTSSIITFLGIFCLLFLIFFVFFVTKSLAAITCLEPKEECIEDQGKTRDVDGFIIDPGCWRKRFTYECREKADNNCQFLRDQKCSQIGSKCKIMLSGTCVVQDETYNCPVKKCDIKEVPCGKDIFCIGGNCAPSNPVKAKDKDLEKAIAYLSSISEMANQVKEQNSRNFVIFAGKPMECTRYALPGLTKDCCADNEGIFSCDAEEKELSEMRKAGRVIEVGRYCNNEDPIFHQCTSYHTANCVFGSRIARIIQNDGRKKQLGIGFGYVSDDEKSSHVDCRGITKDELAKMKFDLMDFSELFDEIRKEAEKRSPKEGILKQKAAGYSHDDLKSRSTKNLGVSESSEKPETGIGLKAAERIKDFYGERIKK